MYNLVDTIEVSTAVPFIGHSGSTRAPRSLPLRRAANHLRQGSAQHLDSVRAAAAWGASLCAPAARLMAANEAAVQALRGGRWPVAGPCTQEGVHGATYTGGGGGRGGGRGFPGMAACHLYVS